MKIKGIIFDKDGTLFDFQSSWGKATFEFLTLLSDGDSLVLSKLATTLNFDLARKIFLPNSIFIAGTTCETIALFQSILPKKSKDEILKLHSYCYSKQKQIPIKNLHTILKRLHKTGFVLSVATNDLYQPTIRQLKEARIFKFFSFIIGADSGFGAKPAPSQLNELKERKGLGPEEIVMVGDSPTDMIAAKSGGFNSFGVLTGVADKHELELYTEAVFKDISFLWGWLEEHNS